MQSPCFEDSHIRPPCICQAQRQRHLRRLPPRHRHLRLHRDLPPNPNPPRHTTRNRPHHARLPRSSSRHARTPSLRRNRRRPTRKLALLHRPPRRAVLLLPRPSLHAIRLAIKPKFRRHRLLPHTACAQARHRRVGSKHAAGLPSAVARGV